MKNQKASIAVKDLKIRKDVKGGSSGKTPTSGGKAPTSGGKAPTTSTLYT